MYKNFDKIGVIGNGSWATALVKIFCENLKKTNWWIYEAEIANHIKEFYHNPDYLSSVEFDPEQLNISNDIIEIINESEVLVLALPSIYLKNVFEILPKGILKDKIIFNAIKGIIPDDNLLVSDYLMSNFEVKESNIGIITGPCHAEEVALERLSYLTVACQDSIKVNEMISKINCRYIKATPSDDIYGTAYAGVLKNIFALASGICHGLGYGDNFNAVLISNAIQEMKRFVDAVHPINRDIKDSAYLGDLLVTAYSQFSRNRFFGNLIGKGYTVKYAKAEMNMIAEGYYATKCINEINKKYGVYMPITDATYKILYEKASAKKIMKTLSLELK